MAGICAKDEIMTTHEFAKRLLTQPDVKLTFTEISVDEFYTTITNADYPLFNLTSVIYGSSFVKNKIRMIQDAICTLNIELEIEKHKEASNDNS
jgi:hypothetical protein